MVFSFLSCGRFVWTVNAKEEYTCSMSLQLKKEKKKKKKKANKENAIKIILPTEEETNDEEDLAENVEDSDEEQDDEGGMYMEKEDVQLIYNALKNYKPTGTERALYDTWLEMFEETLVVDFGVRLPGFEDWDEEDD